MNAQEIKKKIDIFKTIETLREQYGLGGFDEQQVDNLSIQLNMIKEALIITSNQLFNMEEGASRGEIIGIATIIELLGDRIERIVEHDLKPYEGNRDYE